MEDEKRKWVIEGALELFQAYSAHTEDVAEFMERVYGNALKEVVRLKIAHERGRTQRAISSLEKGQITQETVVYVLELCEKFMEHDLYSAVPPAHHSPKAQENLRRWLELSFKLAAFI
jgi:hypothetical protein